MAGKLRKLPQRTCVGCRNVRPKKELVRIVRDPEGGISVDPTGKKAGRGAYICPSAECLEKAVKQKRLERALARPIPPDVHEQLRATLAAGGA